MARLVLCQTAELGSHLPTGVRVAKGCKVALSGELHGIMRAEPDPTHATRPPHSEVTGSVLDGLNSTQAKGLSDKAAAERLAAYGPNRLDPPKPISNAVLLLRQFMSPVVALLVAAAVLSLVLRDVAEAVAIGVVLAINTAIGFLAEQRAVRSMEALRQLDVHHTRVRRAGIVQSIPVENAVPGDMVLVEAGDRVPADMRIVTASALAADESPLTGESLSVDKSADSVAADAPLHARTSMLYKGTAVTRGSAEAVIVATGVDTEVGRIAELVAGADDERSPLEKRLTKLAQQLIVLTLAIAVALGVLGLMSGEPLAQMLQATIALAIAAIPEGLPIVATLALGRGMLKMARRNALVRSLGAIETLGATTVILTDKTGTLTENKMSLHRLVSLADDLSLEEESKTLRTRALTIAALCSNASLGENGVGASGDTLEVALLEAAAEAGLRPSDVRNAHPRTLEHAFDTATRMMATVHDDNGAPYVAVKGAPEAVLAHTTRIATGDGDRAFGEAEREAIEAIMHDLAAEGLRLIALAETRGEARVVQPFEDLTIVGIAALRDPPRADIPGAIAACHRAGIRVVMVTGDHPDTARAIATSVGLHDGDRGPAVHARVTPENKLKLVSGFQEAGEIVAMTGDGVNDAPALRQADIGVAMGVRGTDVAREAADIVLLDDAFTSIVTAVREGRVIFANIRRFCVYLLSCNLGEVLLIALALLAGLPLPLTPLQILFLNLVTDVFPAFALAMSKGDPNVVNQPPRPVDEAILGRLQWVDVVVYGTAVGVSSLAAFVVALHGLGLSMEGAGTVAFLTIGFAQLWHVFNMRSVPGGFFANEVFTNVYVWGAIALCATLFALTLIVPDLRAVLGMVWLPAGAFVLIGAASLLPLLLGQAIVFAKGLRAH